MNVGLKLNVQTYVCTYLKIQLNICSFVVLFSFWVKAVATRDHSVTCIRDMNVTVHVSDFCSVSQHTTLSLTVMVDFSPECWGLGDHPVLHGRTDYWCSGKGPHGRLFSSSCRGYIPWLFASLLMVVVLILEALNAVCKVLAHFKSALGFPFPAFSPQ